MNPGEAFEIKCYEYLKQLYKNKPVEFDLKGGMDSSISDIAVIKNNLIDFYIEAKDTSAQAGQFVLIPDERTKTFVFSPRNRSKPNSMTNIMIEYMNQNFDLFNNAGTAGKHLDIDANVFTSWIMGHYNDRNVKYFISYKNEFVILPIRKFPTYFDVIANYRIKKSGSGDPAKRDFGIIKSTILSMYPSASFNEKDKKLYAAISEHLSLEKFKLGEYTYYFAKQDQDGIYRIRRLSNTYNMNVIFSIQLKSGQDLDDLKAFESDL